MHRHCTHCVDIRLPLISAISFFREFGLHEPVVGSFHHVQNRPMQNATPTTGTFTRKSLTAGGVSDRYNDNDNDDDDVDVAIIDPNVFHICRRKMYSRSLLLSILWTDAKCFCLWCGSVRWNGSPNACCGRHEISNKFTTRTDFHFSTQRYAILSPPTIILPLSIHAHVGYSRWVYVCVCSLFQFNDLLIFMDPFW